MRGKVLSLLCIATLFGGVFLLQKSALAQTSDVNWAPRSEENIFVTVSDDPKPTSTCDMVQTAVRSYKRFSIFPSYTYGERCMVPTSYGYMQGDYFRYHSSPVIYEINWPARAVKNTSLAFRFEKESNPGGGSSRDVIRIFDKFPENLKHLDLAKRDLMSVANNDNSWIVKNPESTASQGASSRIAFSENGKFAVMPHSNRLIVIDVENRTSKYFHQYSTGSYSWNGVPRYLAITNDGKHAMYAMGYDGPGYIEIINIDSCSTTDIAEAKNKVCDTTQILPKIAESLGFELEYGGISDIDFSNDGTRISFNVRNPEHKEQQVTVSIADSPIYGHDYIALGDSFSSGEGDRTGEYLYGTDGDAVAGLPGNEGVDVSLEKCHLSSRSYPYLIAERLEMSDFNSVACSGSKAEDIIMPVLSYKGRYSQFGGNEVGSDLVKSTAISFTPGRIPQLEFIKKYQPEYITLTIGGNDINFAGKISSCIKFGDCEESKAEGFLAETDLLSFKSALNETLSSLREASDQSKIYIAGYPRLFDVEGEQLFGCRVNGGFSKNERAYADGLVKKLNETVRQSAEQHNVAYVNIENVLEGTNLCTDAKPKTVNGLTVGDDEGVSIAGEVVAIKLNFVGAESFHPNEHGHKLMAERFITVMEQNPSGVYVPPADSTVNLSEHDMSYDEICSLLINCNTEAGRLNANLMKRDSPLTLKAESESVIKDSPKLEMGTPAFGKEDRIRLYQTGLTPGYQVDVVAFSSPAKLGSFTVDADGVLDVSVEIPDSFALGLHTMHIFTTIDGVQGLNRYQQFFVIDSPEDLDGDGILNDLDSCTFIAPSGIDENDDGIDDGCQYEAAEPSETEPIDDTKELPHDKVPAPRAVDDHSEQSSGQSQQTERPTAFVPIKNYVPMDERAVLGKDDMVYEIKTKGDQFGTVNSAQRTQPIMITVAVLLALALGWLGFRALRR